MMVIFLPSYMHFYDSAGLVIGLVYTV